MSPEYALEGRFSAKSDVFSFGVIVLEILSAQKMTSFRHKELSLNLLGHAWKLWREDRIIDFLDPTLGGICNADQFLRCINVGLLCVQEGTADRPSMSSVVLMLSSELANLPQPKPPAYSLRTAPVDSDLPSFPDHEDPICSVNDITVSSMEPR
ncbi:hypothetical protein EJ110_NYTH34756 [Nymphaea thermarum]|nr:hypothetical protein EJ110_NYTH34756 [Nymphaea thermarum]